MISTAFQRDGDSAGDALDSEWLAGKDDVSGSELDKLGSDHSASEEEEEEEEDNEDDLDGLGCITLQGKVRRLGVRICADSLLDVWDTLGDLDVTYELEYDNRAPLGRACINLFEYIHQLKASSISFTYFYRPLL